MALGCRDVSTTLSPGLGRAALLAAAAAAGVLLLVVPSEAAGRADVDVRDYRYAPTRSNVVVGDSVVWTVAEGVHTVIAEDESFRSGDRRAGDTFSVTFDRVGRFPYYCQYDREFGMRGVVEVRAAPGPAATSTSTTAPPPTTTTTVARTTTTTAPPVTTVPPPPVVIPAPVYPTTPPSTDPLEATPPPGPETSGDEPTPEEREEEVASADEKADDTTLRTALAVVLGIILVGVGAYAWYNRPSRFDPA